MIVRPKKCASSPPRLPVVRRAALYFLSALIALPAQTILAVEPSGDSKCAEILKNDLNQELAAKASAQAQALENEYKKRLGVLADPFLFAYSPEKAQIIETQMTERRGAKGKMVPSPYAMAEVIRVKHILGDQEFKAQFVNEILRDAEVQLKDENADREILQQDFLALRELQNYLGLFAPPAPTVDQDGNPADEGAKKQDKQEKEKPPSQKPKYPEPHDDYKADASDTDSGDAGDKQEKMVVAQVNARVPFFEMGYYYDIRRPTAHNGNTFFSTPLIVDTKKPGLPRETGKTLIVNMLGGTQGRLILPVGYLPLQPFTSDAEIVPNVYGSYELNLTRPMDNVRIPLVEDKSIALPPVLKMAATPVGYKFEEWPEDVRVLIEHLKAAKLTPYETAKRVEEFLRKNYLYRVKGRNTGDPIESMRKGAFRCDAAAYLMAAILRDQFHLPVRVADGYRSEYKNREAQERFLRMPQKEAHTWTEVYIDGRWYMFDPTPEKKDKVKDEEGEPDDARLDSLYDQEPEQNEALEQNQQESDDQSRESDSQSDEKKKLSVEELKKKIAGDTEKTSAEVREQSEKYGNARDTSGENEEFKGLLDDTELQLGSLDGEPKLETNPFRRRLGRLLLRLALDPRYSGDQITNNLNLIRQFFYNIHSDDAEIKQFFNRAFEIHNEDHPPLVEWIDQVALHMKTRPLGKTYNEVYRILESIQLYSELLDKNDAALKPIELQQALVRVLEILNRFAHPDSAAIATVKKFYDDLSPFLQSVLAEDFKGFTVPGPDQATKNVFNAMKSGKLDDLRLVSLLTHHADFILNSTPRPEFKEIRTWMRDTRRVTGRDILPLESVSQLPQSIMGQPSKSIEENINEGTAFSFVHRLRRLIQDGSGVDGSERVTVILYDVSGSMNGDWAKFQAALIAAFTSMAASDVNAQGQPRHKVLIIPFGMQPYPPIYVYNREQALDLIRHYQMQMGNRGDGTNYTAAILEGLHQIALAQQQAGNPLASANILLMGDGQDTIGETELQQFREARTQIDRDTPVQIMFAAINTTNPSLAKLAEESPAAGFAQGFYREFNSDTVHEIMAQAEDHSFLKDNTYMYSDKPPSVLPNDVLRLLQRASSLARAYSDAIVHQSQSFTSMDIQLQNWSRIPWPRQEIIDRPLQIQIKKLRADFMYGLTVFQTNRRWMEYAASDICTNFAAITGIEPTQLSQKELEDFRHFIKFAAGRENGDGEK